MFEIYVVWKQGCMFPQPLPSTPAPLHLPHLLLLRLNVGCVDFSSSYPSSMASVTVSDKLQPRGVCIVGVARTPMGGLLDLLSSLTATKLGSIAIACVLKRANVNTTLVQEVYVGNVLSTNLGQAPTRHARLGVGIPNSVICTTINKVYASRMKATMIVALTIQLGIHDIVVVGGMESMSNAPKYLAEARKGSRFGNDTIVDGKNTIPTLFRVMNVELLPEMVVLSHGR